jgi:hypothetical protein
VRTGLSLQIGKNRVILASCSEGAKRNLDKGRQISRIWMGVSLLKEQGDYHCSAGT